MQREEVSSTYSNVRFVLCKAQHTPPGSAPPPIVVRFLRQAVNNLAEQRPLINLPTGKVIGALVNQAEQFIIEALACLTLPPPAPARQSCTVVTQPRRTRMNGCSPPRIRASERQTPYAPFVLNFFQQARSAAQLRAHAGCRAPKRKQSAAPCRFPSGREKDRHAFHVAKRTERPHSVPEWK